MAHLCKTRGVGAGSIVGAGPVSNREGARRGALAPGYSCIAEQRSIETIAAGAPGTPYMRFGDAIRIDMFDEKGKSVFGAIEQKVSKP